jgi:Fe-S cluster biosynthesis and repair protein YggX
MTLVITRETILTNGWRLPLVENTHRKVDVPHLKKTLGKKKFSELSVTGKTTLKEGQTIITYELKET